MNKKFTKLLAALALLVFMTPSLVAWGQTRESYNVTYNYSDLGDMLYGSFADASTYWKVPESAGNSAVISVPITNQPESNITVTFHIATFGSGNNPTASNTTITAVGTESNSNWTGSGVSSYPSSSTYVDGVMTITKPQNPTTLAGLEITMGVSTGVKIFRLQSITVSYTFGGGTTPTTYSVTFNAGDGTFVGNSDFPSTTNTKEAGEYTLPSAEKDGFTFNGWVTGNNSPINGSYTVSGDVDFTAQYTENATPGPGGETLTFDFEDEGAHRPNTNNSYTGTNTYSENDATITLTYADAVTTGTPINGLANVLGRIAKNTTNSPTIHIGSIDITNKTITSVAYSTKGVQAMSQVLEYSLDNSTWNSLLTLSSMPTSATIETASNLSITGTDLYLRWTTSVSSSTGSNRDFQLDDIVITYTTSSNPTPSIAASNVEIAYDATSGNIAYTINNEPTPAGTLTAAVAEGATIADLSLGTPSNGTIAFTCAANAATTTHTATVMLTYTYGDNEIVTKNVIITQAAAPVIYTTISDIFEAATSTPTDVNVTFGNWVVSGVSGLNAFVTDNNGNGFIIYTSDHGFVVNDKLSGTVMGTPLKLYNGSAEFTNLTKTTDGLSVSNDGAITVITDKTIADLGGVNTGAVITLSSLTYDGTNLSDGTNTIKPYSTLFGGTFVSGKTYNVTGVYQQFNSTKEILPRSAADIEEVVSTEPSITVTPNEVNVGATPDDEDFIEGTLDITYENLTINAMSDFGIQYYDAVGEEIPTSNEPLWIEVLVAEQDPSVGVGYVVSYTILENDEEARTAYFKVFAFDENSEPVYSNLVTVNQAGIEVPPTGDQYVLYTGILVEGDYVICYNNTTWTAAMKNTVESSRLSYEEVTPNDEDVIITDDATIVWHIAPINGYWTIYNAAVNKYAASTGADNKAQLLSDGTDDKALWTTEDAYEFVNKYNSEHNKNAYLRNNTTNGFACYNPNNVGGALSLYKKVVESHTIQFSVNGEIIEGLEMESSEFQLLPYSLEGYESYVPNGYYFKGWFEGDDIYLTQTEPDILPAEWPYLPTTDVTLKAVFAMCDVVENPEQGTISYANCSNYCTRVYPLSGNLTNAETEEGKAYYIVPSDGTSGGAWVPRLESATINGVLGNSNPWDLDVAHGAQLVVNNPVMANVYEGVAGYEVGGHWVFISSPLTETCTAAAINAIPEGTSYDLYYYDEAKHYWRNHKSGEDAGFNIVPTKGYLYAVKAYDQDLQFVGHIQPYVEEGITVDLDYTPTINGENNPLAGWNLVGNPFPFEASINKPYYDYGYDEETETWGLLPYEDYNLVRSRYGVMVKADSDNETVTFTKAESMDYKGSIGISVVGETLRGASSTNLDKVIVSFNEGSQLEKFVIDADNVKLYIPQNGKDYAIVSAEAQGEMPVNFCPAKNGTYTISINAKNVDVNYLHLIDNMTGMDIDLLQTPSYTFEATTRDYESRFKLVFAGASTGSAADETFAFFSNGSLIVSNEGEATLQVVDLTGRILSSESINGSCSTRINAMAGVYMLRLINGDNVKVQKVVVR